MPKRLSVSPEEKNKQKSQLEADIAAVNKIPIIPQLLDVICRTTGMRFSAIARVTDEKWITCTSLDNIPFGLKRGDELPIETTMCNSVRKTSVPIFIDEAEKDEIFKDHPIPKMYGITSYVSFPIYRKDGSFFGTLCAIDSVPARVRTPEIQGMFKLFADLIAFHLQAVEELDIVAQKLEEEKKNTELREQFIAILGHDLRNPISSNKMSADILLMVSQDEMVRKQAQMIKASSYRMDGLIENILDFARGRLGEGIQLNMEINDGSLEEMLDQVIKEIQTVSPDRNIIKKYEFEDLVKCDRNRIGQLLSNLLSNADSHGAEDKPIEVTAVAKDGEFMISVKNSGDQIPESAKEHLFEPFYREKIKKGKQGLGLGLFIAAEIARAHDGELQVESTEKETKFTFQMPVNSVDYKTERHQQDEKDCDQ